MVGRLFGLIGNIAGSLLRVLNIRIPARTSRLIDLWIKRFIDLSLYLIGPLLISLASAIIIGLTYTFLTIIIPLKCTDGNIFCLYGIFHSCMVVFFDVNIIFNYALCVMTKNTGDKYQTVIRELANATGYKYPENEQDLHRVKREYEEKLHAIRTHQHNQQSDRAIPVATANDNTGETRSNNTNLRNRFTNLGANSEGSRAHGWTALGPQEWGFCFKSNQPKPPRAHYDHVTQNLILNMDHYCPWVFNSVGYFNYRYFFNFLLYVFTGMLYGSITSYLPYKNTTNALYKENVRLNRIKGLKTMQHLIPFVPLPQERMAVTLSFIMCLAVGASVFCLFSLHSYLILTAQTTIEFHANMHKKSLLRMRRIQWINPYDLGKLRNWQQVYGSSHPLIAILPSRREPEFLPVPIAGELGRRPSNNSNSYSSSTSNSIDDNAENQPFIV